MGDEADAIVDRMSDPDMGMGRRGGYYRGDRGPMKTAAELAAEGQAALEQLDARTIAKQLEARGFELLELNGHRNCPAARPGKIKHLPADSKYPEMVECGCRTLYTHGVPVGQESTASTALAVPEPSGEPVLAPAKVGRQYHADDPIAATIALIDPTRIYTPEDVERHILDCNSRLERGALFERAAIEAEAEAKLKWQRAFDLAQLRSEEKAADLRKADAMVQTAELHSAFIQAAMVREAIKSTMHNLRGVLSGYQSVGRSVGATYGAAGAGNRT